MSHPLQLQYMLNSLANNNGTKCSYENYLTDLEIVLIPNRVSLVLQFLHRSQIDYMNGQREHLDTNEMFHVAAQCGDICLLEFALQDVQTRRRLVAWDENLEGPCIIATRNEHLEVVKWMMFHGCPCRKEACVAKHSNIPCALL